MGKIIEKTQAIYERLISTGKIMIDPNQPKSEVCGSRENEQQAFEKVARETIFSVEDQVSRQI